MKLLRQFVTATLVALLVFVGDNQITAETVEDILNRADSAYSLGDYRQAILLLKHAERLLGDPSPTSRIQRGQINFRRCQVSDRQGSRQDALKFCKDAAPVYSSQELIATLREEAIALHRIILKYEPNNRDSLTAIATLIGDSPVATQPRSPSPLSPSPSPPSPPPPSPSPEPLVSNPEQQSIVKIEASFPGTVTSGQHGTGWVYRCDGNTAWIVTNRHVIYQKGDNSNNIKVLHSNKRLKAELVHRTAHDAPLDLAVLKVQQLSPCSPLPYTENVQGGQPVRVMGYPNEVWAIRDGKILFVNEDLSGFRLNIPFSKGSSGSPVFDAENRVIGMIAETVISQTIGNKPVEESFAPSIKKIVTEMQSVKF
jgi:tetratricopeptide (TPR) repeat protein